MIVTLRNADAKIPAFFHWILLIMKLFGITFLFFLIKLSDGNGFVTDVILLCCIYWSKSSKYRISGHFIDFWNKTNPWLYYGYEICCQKWLSILLNIWLQDILNVMIKGNYLEQPHHSSIPHVFVSLYKKFEYARGLEILLDFAHF